MSSSKLRFGSDERRWVWLEIQKRKKEYEAQTSKDDYTLTSDDIDHIIQVYKKVKPPERHNLINAEKVKDVYKQGAFSSRSKVLLNDGSYETFYGKLNSRLEGEEDTVASSLSFQPLRPAKATASSSNPLKKASSNPTPTLPPGESSNSHETYRASSSSNPNPNPIPIAIAPSIASVIFPPVSPGPIHEPPPQPIRKRPGPIKRPGRSNVHVMTAKRLRSSSVKQRETVVKKIKWVSMIQDEERRLRCDREQNDNAVPDIDTERLKELDLIIKSKVDELQGLLTERVGLQSYREDKTLSCGLTFISPDIRAVDFFRSVNIKEEATDLLLPLIQAVTYSSDDILPFKVVQRKRGSGGKRNDTDTGKSNRNYDSVNENDSDNDSGTSDSMEGEEGA